MRNTSYSFKKCPTLFIITVKTKERNQIMQYTTPHYYSKFTCSADKCPDTCCAGWQIQIDSRSLKKYKNVNGILRNRLRNEINWKEKCFRRYNGRCAFLNEHNLCDLYIDGGGKSLNDILPHMYGDGLKIVWSIFRIRYTVTTHAVRLSDSFFAYCINLNLSGQTGYLTFPELTES